ncbi:unnamed protein product [Sphagnum balticum]
MEGTGRAGPGRFWARSCRRRKLSGYTPLLIAALLLEAWSRPLLDLSEGRGRHRIPFRYGSAGLAALERCGPLSRIWYVREHLDNYLGSLLGTNWRSHSNEHLDVGVLPLHNKIYPN